MPRTLRIGIDGRGILKTIDGITRYSLNLIRNLAAIDNMIMQLKLSYNLV